MYIKSRFTQLYIPLMFLVFVNLLPKKNSNKQCDTDNLVGIAISTFAVMNLPLSDLVETEYN